MCNKVILYRLDVEFSSGLFYFIVSGKDSFRVGVIQAELPLLTGEKVGKACPTFI